MVKQNKKGPFHQAHIPAEVAAGNLKPKAIPNHLTQILPMLKRNLQLIEQSNEQLRQMLDIVRFQKNDVYESNT